MNNDARTSVMVLIKNASSEPVTIHDLQIAGKPIADHFALTDLKNVRSHGKGVDWYDIRPRTIPSGAAGVIILGYMIRELREPTLALTAVTDKGPVDLSCPTPKPDTLRVACAAFDADLKHLTLIVRNDSESPLPIKKVEFNGRVMDARVKGSPVTPHMSAMVNLDLPSPLALASDCVFHIESDGAGATTWFRAFPSESLNYPYYGMHVDRRVLAEKFMDVYVTHQEAGAHGIAEKMDLNGGNLSDELAKQVAKMAENFGKKPDAWAWYMDDDAGWGRPRPQSLVKLGEFLRSHGSPQQQFLCNPADRARYAWTSDMLMDYWYHSDACVDPTIFGYCRPIETGLETSLKVNEPAPILFLVNTAGESRRWITVAEVELASYAMLGHGARHFGWFLAASVWDQGTTLYGGIDYLENRPMRYQEGAVACLPVWNQVGNIAGVFKTLQPWIAASARLPGMVRPDHIEVLPLLCRDNLVITAILNHRLRCLYPRDFPQGESSGGIKLQPQRDVTISHVLPSWIAPVKVLAFDHDRGLREIPFTVDKGQLTAQVDAVDTCTLLMVCPSIQMADDLKRGIEEREHPSTGGSPIRSELVVTPAQVIKRPWDISSANYRATVSVEGPAPAGAWVKASLPAEPDPYGPLGYFDPRSVMVVAKGKPLKASVDYFRLLSDREDATNLWKFSRDPAKTTIEPETTGVKIVSTWGRDKPGDFGGVAFDGKFDPNYDIIEMERRIEGNLEPLFGYQRTIQGKKTSGLINIKQHMHYPVWPVSEILEVPDRRLPLFRLYWHRLVRQTEKQRDEGKAGDGDVNWQPSEATLGAQIYDAIYHFGEIRQCKSSPDVYFQLRAEIKEGATLTAQVYWNYLADPCKDTPVLPEADRPKENLASSTGPMEGFRIASVRYRLTDQALKRLSFSTEAMAACAWVDVRDATGALLAYQNIPKTDGLKWTLSKTLALPAGAHDVTAYAAGTSGQVVGIPLRVNPPLLRLREIARVSGQVETLSCAADGSWLMAGADKVYAFDATGKPKWTVDLGENRRQPTRHGPGRNIEQVEMRADGQAAFARTFQWDDISRQYTPSYLVVFSPDGKQVTKMDCEWEAGASFGEDGKIHAVQIREKKAVSIIIDPSSGTVADGAPSTSKPLTVGVFQVTDRNVPGKPRAPILQQDGKELYEIDWPPYTLHKRLLGDGRLVMATTQGIVQLMGVDGKVAWKLTRPSRIDGALALESSGLLAIAYKIYPHRWDWWYTPRLELISLADGSVKEVFEGAGYDDFGHYGTHLCLVADQAGNRLFLGGPDGRIYQHSASASK